MKKFAFPLFAFVFALQACNLPSNAPATTDNPNAATSAPAAGDATQPPQVEQVTATVTLANTDTPMPTATLQNPTVLRATLCWLGPGNKYDVVSALKIGTQVTLIGRGTVDGWWVISNPIYKDPCWVQATDVQIDPGFDTSALKLINPPPLPTSTPLPTKVPSPTPV